MGLQTSFAMLRYLTWWYRDLLVSWPFSQQYNVRKTDLAARLKPFAFPRNVFPVSDLSPRWTCIRLRMCRTRHICSGGSSPGSPVWENIVIVDYYEMVIDIGSAMCWNNVFGSITDTTLSLICRVHPQDHYTHEVMTYLSAINEQNTCMYQHSPVRENNTFTHKIQTWMIQRDHCACNIQEKSTV